MMRSTTEGEGRRSQVAGAALLAVVLAGALHLPRVAGDIGRALPVLRMWGDVDAQNRQQLGAVPYDVLRRADALLPPDATVVLVTPGTDVRHLEYTTFHRALYYLTPRPVWWLSPASPDGTWESRFWISAPTTPQSVRAVAATHGSGCALTVGLTLDPAAGPVAADLNGGALVEVGPPGSCRLARSLAPSSLSAGGWWPVRLAGALVVMLLLGYGLTRLIAPRAPGGMAERWGRSWAIGSGVTSLLMFWLSLGRVGLAAQAWVITAVAAGTTIAARRRKRALPPTALRPPTGVERAAIVTMVGISVASVVMVAVLAVGRPLTVWDSWVNAASKARTVYVERRVTPAVYADASRVSTLPYYPLLVPLTETWVYEWIGAPDDRLAGSLSVLWFLALLAVVGGAVSRRAGRLPAWAAVAALASLPHVSGIAAAVLPDLPVAALAAVAVIGVADFPEWGSPALVVGALAAGLLPWAKREGWVLLVLIAAFGAVVARRRAATRVLVACLASGLALAGPWWLLVSLTGRVDSEFLPISLDLARLPHIAKLVGGQLASWDWDLLWIAGAVAIVVLARRVADGMAAVTVVYLLVMAISYLFTSFAPYQAQIASSYFRIAAQAAPLLVLWLGCSSATGWHRAARRLAPPDRA